MPYKKTEDLPDSIKDHLPKAAQEIYMKAFNNAYDNYHEHKEKIRSDDTVEVVAHKVAWSAVKKVYYKNEKDKWVKKP